MVHLTWTSPSGCAVQGICPGGCSTSSPSAIRSLTWASRPLNFNRTGGCAALAPQPHPVNRPHNLFPQGAHYYRRHRASRRNQDQLHTAAGGKSGETIGVPGAAARQPGCRYLHRFLFPTRVGGRRSSARQAKSAGDSVSAFHLLGASPYDRQTPPGAAGRTGPIRPGRGPGQPPAGTRYRALPRDRLTDPTVGRILHRPPTAASLPSLTVGPDTRQSSGPAPGETDRPGGATPARLEACLIQVQAPRRQQHNCLITPGSSSFLLQHTADRHLGLAQVPKT